MSNDSTNYDSEITLNSNRINQGANLLNQSLNISGNYSSRRGSIKNQEYVNFLNEWKNLHFYNDPILNESSLNIVPEEIDQNNNHLQEENIVKPSSSSTFTPFYPIFLYFLSFSILTYPFLFIISHDLIYRKII